MMTAFYTCSHLVLQNSEEKVGRLIISSLGPNEKSFSKNKIITQYSRQNLNNKEGILCFYPFLW